MTSSTGQTRCRRLDIPGTTVHLEPIATGGGRPLREPRPQNGPYQAGPSEGPSREKGPSREGSPQGDLFPPTGPSSEQSSGYSPGDSSGPPTGPESGPLLAGAVPSGTGLAHRWLRQRGLFAELRALEESAGDDTIERGKALSVRLSPVQATLLSEAVACSRYRSRSAYLRAAATGRDRRAPILAKGGLLFFWVRAHLGDEVGTEKRRHLQRLTQFLYGTEIEEALALIRRHLRAAQLAAGDRLEGERELPPTPESVRHRMPQDLNPTASVRFCGERKRLIEENVGYSAYDNRSEYIRHMAFGWDRNAEILSQCATVAEWMEDCRGKGPQSSLDGQGSHERMSLRQVGSEEWDQLEDAMHRHFGIFLTGPGASGQVDVEGALRRGTRHLLGAAPEQFASRVPAQF